MTDIRDHLTLRGAFRTPEVALFVSQLDDLTRRLEEDLAGATVEELGWQPARGCNSIGMLLAHIAVVEVFWIQVAPLELREFDTRATVGIALHDDGIPLAEDGVPPEALAGRDLAWCLERIRLARAHTVTHLADIQPAQLVREFRRTRKNGVVQESDLRWVLYHVVEHLSGHYGQILLLRHLYRERARLSEGVAKAPLEKTR